MKLLTKTVLSLSLLALTSPCLSQVEMAATQNSQTISIARSGTQPSQTGRPIASPVRCASIRCSGRKIHHAHLAPT